MKKVTRQLTVTNLVLLVIRPLFNAATVINMVTPAVSVPSRRTGPASSAPTVAKRVIPKSVASSQLLKKKVVMDLVGLVDSRTMRLLLMAIPVLLGVGTTTNQFNLLPSLLAVVAGRLVLVACHHAFKECS